MSRKTMKSYWDQYYINTKPRVADKGDIIRVWLNKYIPSVSPNDNKTCIEIGCYPGKFLSVFGELGYRLYGIDFCEQVPILLAALEKMGHKVGNIWKEDFLSFDMNLKFDVVASFGFIEHFENFEEVILKHILIVKDNGYLVIEVPNFTGKFQNWLHRTFDRTNYDRHYMPALNMESWISILRSNNLRILYKGYIGNFTFWTEPEDRGVTDKLFLSALSWIKPLLVRILPKDNKLYSPFCGIIARKQ